MFSGIDDPCGAAGDFIAVVIGQGLIGRVAIGAGGSDVDLIILEVAPFPRDPWEDRLVWPVRAIAAEFAVIDPKVFTPNRLGGASVFVLLVIGGDVGEGVDISGDLFQGGVGAIAVNLKGAVPVGIKDIAIPVDLAEAMSKEAQAERERRADKSTRSVCSLP